MSLNRVIDVAADRRPADVLLKGTKVVNVFSGEIQEGNVAISRGIIAGVGDYHRAAEIYDLEGRLVLPGLIDGHMHLESTMLTPEGFAEAAVPHGTTTVVADPHEIVNVCGLDGFRYMVEASRKLPLEIFFTVPSCVPSTAMETAGSAVGPQEIREAFRFHPNSPALGEMMNYPGVIQGDQDTLEIIETAAEFSPRVDGHAPLVSGRQLMAYTSAGIMTDHECTTREEAMEKLRLGMMIAIREGSAAQNLKDLLPAVNDHNYPHFFFCCDDRHPGDLLEEGGIVAVLRKAVARRMPPVRAVQLATINPARYYCLHRRGAVAPGYQADLLVVDNLKRFQPEAVFKNGQLVARDGEIKERISRLEEVKVRDTVRLPELYQRLDAGLEDSNDRVRAIEVIPGQLMTRELHLGAQEALKNKHVARMAVVERHGKNGNIGLGLVKGMGALKGAIASTVAHDSHNIVVVGHTVREMERAVRYVAKCRGGIAVVDERDLLYQLPLPIAGLMSDRYPEEVKEDHHHLMAAARRIGCKIPDPFMVLSFLALPVIPELKLTDRGLVDVNNFQLVDLRVEEA